MLFVNTYSIACKAELIANFPVACSTVHRFGLADRTDKITETVAKASIGLALSGVRNTKMLRKAMLTELAASSFKGRNAHDKAAYSGDLNPRGDDRERLRAARMWGQTHGPARCIMKIANAREVNRCAAQRSRAAQFFWFTFHDGTSARFPY